MAVGTADRWKGVRVQPSKEIARLPPSFSAVAPVRSDYRHVLACVAPCGDFEAQTG
jgi:hypothetical protein